MHAKKLTITNRQKALLHAVKQANNLSDAQYREILYEAAGVWTSTGLTQAGFDQVLDAFATLDYEMPAIRPRPHFTERAGRASPAQLRYIDSLRRQVFRNFTESGFSHWLNRYFQVTHLNFLTPKNACGVIEALKHMAARENEKNEGEQL